jgi:hypothetical protein
MPTRRVSHTPPHESIILPPPNQSSTLILPTIVEGAEHPAFGDIPEVHLYQPINTSTEAESSHNTATSSQATIGAPCQPLPQVPSPIHTLPGGEETNHVQINDWNDEAEEEAVAVEEEELARVQKEIEKLRQEQESILRSRLQCNAPKTRRQNINR